MYSTFGLEGASENGFSVNIPEAHNVRKGGWTYHSLGHKQEYSIKMMNNRSTRCDAKVYIDGKDMGTWRINPMESITVERPVDAHRKFTFFKADSDIGRRVSSSMSNKGVVKVVFKPAREVSWYNSLGYEGCVDSLYTNNSFGSRKSKMESYSAGVTGLGHRSDQSFGSVSAITDVDTENITTIELRLIVDNTMEDEYVPLTHKSYAHHRRAPPPFKD